MIRSIRIRLLLWILCGMVVLLAVLGIVIYEVMCQSLRDGFDAVLSSTARTIGGFFEQTREEIKVEIDERQAPEFSRAERPDYYQLWRVDGTVLARSPSIQGQDLPRIEGLPDEPVFRNLRLPDGRAGRAIGLLFVLKTDEDIKEPIRPQQAVLVVARDAAALDGEIAYLRWLLAMATGGTILLALFVGAVVVRQGLKPLDALAARIAAIRHDDLSTQVRVDRMPDEMAPIAERLNDLLKRLDQAFRRERAFAADVAHELRTPLAGMRCTLEVALTRPRPADDYRQALAECLEITRQMQAMIDSLSMLARFEDGQVKFHPSLVRVGELVETTWRPLADQARARNLSFESHIPADLACNADRDTLHMMLTSLFENAAEYANAGGHIEVVTEKAGDCFTISIANTGCRLSAEEVQHVFERFWRGDPARTGTGVHCGLGLALVQRAAAAMGGKAAAQVCGGTFTVSLSFPAAP